MVLVLFGGLMVYPTYAQTMHISEYRITSNTASQENPDIDGDNIVYQDNRNSSWDIYLYNLAGQYAPDTRITTNSANQINPAISGPLIVYEDYRNGDADIYMYNLTSQTETRITINNASQTAPEIDGNRIVWQDNRNGNSDIYMYDLTNRTERRITTTASNENPAISGTLIVYQKWITINNVLRKAVYYYDLLAGTETQVSGEGNTNDNPAVSGTRIVWESSRTFELKSQWEVVYRDVSIPLSTWETSNPSNQQNPDIYGTFIVYQDDRNYTINYMDLSVHHWSDIYLFNFDTQTETRLTSDTTNQINPAVNGNHVVYQDDRNGNWDIYMTTVALAVRVGATAPHAAAPTTQPTPEQTTQPTQTSETKNPSIIPAELQIPILAAAVVIVIGVVALAVYFRKRTKEVPAKTNADPA